jgi:rubredoxin
MGVKVKDSMYCPRCQAPVAAQRNTHRARNAAAVVALPVTAGLSALGARYPEEWHCPRCGGAVIHQSSSPAGAKPRTVPWVDQLVQARRAQGEHTEQELAEYRDTLMRRYELGDYAPPGLFARVRQWLRE